MKNIRTNKIHVLIFSFVIALSIVLGSTVALMAADDTSLQEQINNAQNGTVITLNKDYNEAITIPAGKDITLDLNGHTLTSPTNTVILNNGTLTIKDSAGTGKISKEAQEGDTFGVNNNGTLNIQGGSIEIKTVVRGVAHGVNNANNATLSVSGGNIYSLTVGENWAFGIFNRGKITEISGGSIKGQIDNPGNGFNALGISNEAGAEIELISGGTISAQVNNNGKAWAIRNRGLIKEIKGGKLSGLTTGSQWAMGIWNTANGQINKISGGTFHGAIQNPTNGNNGLGISNHADDDNKGNPVINLISGGVFIGQTTGGGQGFGFRSDGDVNNVTGGAYKGNKPENALVRRNGKLQIAEGMELKPGTFFHYIMPKDGFYVEIVDEYENWLATYTYGADGKVTSTLGENPQEKYTIFNWNKNDTEKTVECTADDLGELKANTTLYAKTSDKPVYYFLGSSVTLGHTTGGISFVDYLAQDKGWITIKKAVSGTTLVDSGDQSYIRRMKNQIGVNAGMDHFICQLSTNDANGNKPLGKISDSKDMKDFDTSTIIGAIEYIIAYARENWNCPVTFYTNPHFDNSLYKQMVDALYDLQKKWDIGIIDFYNYRNMEALSRETLNSYMSDPIHPNENGYRWMAQVMGELLEKGDLHPEKPEPGTEDPGTTPGNTPAPTDSGNNDATPKPETPSDTGDDAMMIMVLLLCLSGSFAAIFAYKMKKSHN